MLRTIILLVIACLLLPHHTHINAQENTPTFDPPVVKIEISGKEPLPSGLVQVLDFGAAGGGQGDVTYYQDTSNPFWLDPHRVFLYPGYSTGALFEGTFRVTACGYHSKATPNATLTTPEALEADLAAGERRGMQIEMGQFRQGLASAAVVVVADRDMERRLVLACSMPAAEMLTSARVVRAKLTAAARNVAEALSGGESATA